MAEMLRLLRVDKRFGGIHAVSDVDLTIDSGEIHGLIGPNGAGKSTLINLISGIYSLTSGKIIFDKQEITHDSSVERAKAGIARTFQTIRLWDELSLAENVKIGAQCRLQSSLVAMLCRTKKFRANEKSLQRAAGECLELVGLGEKIDKYASELAYGQRRLLEIARALATRPKLLLLDEPAAGMNQQEANALAELIQLIRARGIAVLVIEHNMKFIMGLCDRVTVLNFGKNLFVGEPSAVQNETAVVKAYLGE